MIYVPYVDGLLRPETLRALQWSGLPFKMVELRGDFAYSDWLLARWGEGDNLAIVEHDIIPTTDQLIELSAHPADWRGYHYDLPPFGEYLGLGCVAFSKALLRHYPRAMLETSRWRDKQHPPGHWCRVDGWLKLYLTLHGEQPLDLGKVVHLHSGGPRHGCVHQHMEVAEKSGNCP